MDIIKNSITSIISLDDKEWQELQNNFEIKTFKKNTHLLKEGQTCKFVAFVCYGTWIYYKLTDLGKESTTDFAFSGDWITDNRSRLNNTPSLINIKAIEESKVALISNKHLNKMYFQIPKLERLGRILIEHAFVKMTQQSIDFKTLSAKQRYEKLLLEHPEIFRKIPLYHIANYLGIVPKSLSRIRKG